jgi:vacuolar-type H+-ATPase subunit E/Vma4
MQRVFQAFEEDDPFYNLVQSVEDKLSKIKSTTDDKSGNDQLYDLVEEIIDDLYIYALRYEDPEFLVKVYESDFDSDLFEVKRNLLNTIGEVLCVEGGGFFTIFLGKIS